MKKRALDKVIGYESIKRELYRIIDSLKYPEKYERLGVSMMKGILFSGYPGIGKSLMAEAVIKEIGWKTISLKKNLYDDEFNEYVVNSFAKAKTSAPAIVYMDDIDKYSKGRSGKDIYSTIQACIDDCKNERVFIIATANDLDTLPDSLYRAGRIDKKYAMTFPDGEDAKRIFNHYLGKTKTVGTVDAEEIARCLHGYSCAYLETLVKEAAIIAGYASKKKIEQEDLRTACLRLFFGAPESLEELSSEEKKKVAIHEAGHTVVAELLMPGCVNFVSIKAMESNTLGITSRQSSSKREIKSARTMENEIMISLAGKAATEITLGEIDTGANSDMHMAFDKTRALLDDYTGYNFNSWCHGGETAETVYQNLDISTQSAVAKYYAETKSLLIKNRSMLDELTEAILDNETLFYKDIESICFNGSVK